MRRCGAILIVPGPGPEPADEASCSLANVHESEHEDETATTADGRPVKWRDGELPWRADGLWRLGALAGAAVAIGWMIGLTE